LKKSADPGRVMETSPGTAVFFKKFKKIPPSIEKYLHFLYYSNDFIEKGIVMNKQTGIFLRLASHLVVSGIALFLLCGQLSGLDPDKPVEQYLIDQWETSNGIPSNLILSISQTPDGYLWFATSKGLVRFDGITFTPVRFTEQDPEENPIPDFLLVDSEGTLWIGSSSGLTSYNYHTGQFKTYTHADGITKDRIRRIKEDMKGNLWISFFSGYTDRFSGGEITSFNESHGLGGKKINGIVEARNGDLLFGTRENGVFVFRNGKFFKYPIEGLDNAQIIHMLEDHKGELWICSNTGLFHITDRVTRKYTTRDGLLNDYVTYILEDSSHSLWVGTRKGLNRFRGEQDGTVVFESFPEPFTIICLFEDSEKSLWVGTYDSGIKRLKDGKFTSYEPYAVKEEYRDAMIFSMFEDRGGDTWIGALGGKLFRCRDNRFIEALDIEAAADTAITAITEDTDGNLWLGTNGEGVLKKENGSVTQFTVRDGLSDNLVTSIFQDSRGNLWFSTFDGVSKYGGGRIESFKSRDGLSGKRVNNVYEDSGGDLWIATDEGVTVLKNGEAIKENMAYYLPDVSVSCIYEEPSIPEAEGRVFWIATHGAGLKRLKRFKEDTVTSYTIAHGLTTNFIYQFFEDTQENFWLMSDSGILRIAKKELNRFADNKTPKEEMINCVSFGISDGMKSIEFENEFSRHSAIKTTKGEFWFITNKGITVVNPARITVNKVPPPVVIETPAFNEKPVDLKRESGENANAFKGITDFLFHFTAPTFLSPEKVKFKYRLEPMEKEWIFLSPGSERTARYRHLEPGTYTFRVIAGNSEGVWNRTGDAVTFTLEPFFHQTVFFKLIILVLVLVLAAGGFYLYKKRPFKKQHEKYKGSSLNPQFAEECSKKLRYLMEMKKIYRDPDISLQALSDKLSVTSHQLSQILNETLERNFSDLINSYRIEEAKTLLLKPGADQQKITTVAFDVGFNTTVAFYNAFKKYTGMTPSQYRKEEKI